MKPQTIIYDKTKIRARKERNLVAKYNVHRGGYHTPTKYVRHRCEEWERFGDFEMNYGEES